MSSLDRSSKGKADGDWVSDRLNEMLDGSLDHLLVRPVHAQMICEIATQKDLTVRGISKSKLYDLFVHYLIEREVHKRGRDPSFDIDARRQFNAALAAWLWERGGASTTTFADIPDELCHGVTRHINHDLDEMGLKRELIAGCLVDKGEQTIYFSHRSLQEFLISEFIIENGIIDKTFISDAGYNNELQNLFSLLNPEIVDFILERLDTEYQVKDIMRVWMPKCRMLRDSNLPIVCLYMLRKLAERTTTILDMRESPWDYWILAAINNRSDDFQIDTPNIEGARQLLDQAFEVGGDTRLGAILHWLYAIQIDNGNSRKLAAVLVSRMMVPSHLQFALQGVTSRRALTSVEKERYIPLEALLTCSTFANENVKKGFITVDITALVKQISFLLGISFHRIFEADETRTIRQHAFCSYADVMREIGIGGTAPGALAAAEKLFDADESRMNLAQYLSGDLRYGRSSKPYSRFQGTIKPRF